MAFVIIISEGVFMHRKLNLDELTKDWKEFKAQYGREKIVEFLNQKGFEKLQKGSCTQFRYVNVGVINGFQ